MRYNLKQYSSLDDALTRFQVPDDNWDLIRKMAEGVGISAYYETSGYIKAVRVGGGPDLHIASGWTNGFVSEAEILRVLGDIRRWGDDERPRLWGVSHPKNRIGNGGGGSGARVDHDYGTCPNCFMAYPASRACGCS